MRKIRFAESGGKPICPKCGCDRHYWLSTRSIWKCKSCYKMFSVTSGTIFASRKLPHKEILRAMALFFERKGNITIEAFAQEMGIDFRAAWYLLKRMREESMAAAEG